MIASRPAQALPPLQRQKDGQGIAGERTVVMPRALPRPHAGAIDPPDRCHSFVGLEGPPAPATWELVLGERERGGKTGSCWAATCASPVSSGIRRTGHWVRAQPHASAVFSNRSTKASGSSWGPILISGTWAIDGAATGFSSRPSKLRMARRSSFCAWTKSRKRSSSCP